MLDLTNEQRSAIELRPQALALTAAAGSGKTTVLVRRYIGLLKSGVKPREILTVTFTTDAAAQLKARILKVMQAEENPSAELVEAVTTTPQIGTIHSFCYRVLDQYGTLAGLEPIDRILSRFEFATAFDRAYRFWLDDLGEEKLRALLQYFTHQELRKTARDLYQGRFFLRRAYHEIAKVTDESEKNIWELLKSTLPPLFQVMEAQFARKGVYSFDDLENLTLKILNDAPEVAARLQREIKFLLVDEFQDTSRLQWEILQKIIGQDSRKLFVVGDPKQSIYGFRNADVSLFMDVTNGMPAMGGETKELTANFRSDPRLLEAINGMSLELFAETPIPFQAMRSGRAAKSEGAFPLKIRRFPYEKRNSGNLPAEINETVKAVKELVYEGAKAEEIAILFRVSDRIPDYYRALLANGIPAECHRTSPLFRSYDVIDLVSFLRAVNNPWNDFHLTAFLRSTYVNFSFAELWEANRRGGDALFEKVQNDERLKWFVGLVESGEWRVQALLQALFRSSKRWPAQQEAFLALLAALSEPALSITDAVERLNAWEDEDIAFEARMRNPNGHPGVRLMTVHAAKGLEFPHVLLADNLRTAPRRVPRVRLETGHLPGLRFRKGDESVGTADYERLEELQTTRELEESKRILYVALTRAEKTLTLVLPKATEPDDLPKGTWAHLLSSVVSA